MKERKGKNSKERFPWVAGRQMRAPTYGVCTLRKYISPLSGVKKKNVGLRSGPSCWLHKQKDGRVVIWYFCQWQIKIPRTLSLGLGHSALPRTWISIFITENRNSSCKRFLGFAKKGYYYTNSSFSGMEVIISFCACPRSFHLAQICHLPERLEEGRTSMARYGR